MIYSVVMRKEMFFQMKADSEEEALDWLSTHDMEDVEKESTYFDYEYEDHVLGTTNVDDYVAIDISTED